MSNTHPNVWADSRDYLDENGEMPDGYSHNAGYIIIETECYNTQGGGVQECIVMGVARGKAPGSALYVTWEALRHPEGHWDYFWGHYFTDERTAREDYHRRLFNHYVEGMGSL